MDNKFYDDNYRRKFIRQADFKTLNNYLFMMEKMSKKSGKILEIYNKDVEFLVNNDIFEKVSDDVLFSNQSDIYLGNTETNIKNINKLIDNNNDKYNNNFIELNNIEICIRNENNNAYNDRNVRMAAKRFIEIIMGCSSMVNNNEELLNSIMYYFKTITSLIKDDKVAIKECYSFFSIILKKDKSKIIMDFMKKLNNLRNKKKDMKDKPELYKQEKNILIQTNIDLYGLESILTTILFDKIYKEFKKIKN
jgi:hypothetical protein